MLGKGKYEKYMSNWISFNLPSSSNGCVVQDLDFIIQNYKAKKFLLLEIKTKGNQLTYAQRKFYDMLHKSLIKTELYDWREYIWTHLLKFEWEGFSDWDVTLDWNIITEKELIEFFNDELWFNL